MGKIWLHDAVGPLRTELGNRLVIYPGAETRSRSTGGFESILGILWHHDADSPSGDDMNAVNYAVKNAADRPVGNFHVLRDGRVVFHTMGASNHAGKGGPVKCSHGTVGLNRGNYHLIGIEASNNGVGEPWKDVQLDSYVTLSAVLCDVYELEPLSDIWGHWTYCEPSCPGRKIDPAGPTPMFPSIGGTSGANKWDMEEARKVVNRRWIELNPIPAAPAKPLLDLSWISYINAEFKWEPVKDVVHYHVIWRDRQYNILGEVIVPPSMTSFIVTHFGRGGIFQVAAYGGRGDGPFAEYVLMV